MPPDLFEKSKPEFVVPMVVHLASEACADPGLVLEAIGPGRSYRCAHPPVDVRNAAASLGEGTGGGVR